MLLNALGYTSEIMQSESELSIRLIINDKDIARVIEGCNSISIIILFIAFIVSFSGKFKTTFLYIVFGSLLIYFMNIFRISVIAIALYEYPQYEYIFHDIIFPSIIYGVTFLLWVIWVFKFSKLR